MIVLYVCLPPDSLGPDALAVSIMLEECGLPYRTRLVDLQPGDLQPEPAARTAPTIIDRDEAAGDPFVLSETGAILLYLAEKAGRLLPHDARDRFDTMQWLAFSLGEVAPWLAEAGRAEPPEPVRPHRMAEVVHLFTVLDRRLARFTCLAGDQYTVADIAAFPWVRHYRSQGLRLENHPHLKRWFDEISGRPAVARGLDLPPKPDGASPDEVG